MKRFFESLSQFIGLMMGSNFNVPCEKAVEYYQYPRFGC
jgi:hypothetical protein